MVDLAIKNGRVVTPSGIIFGGVAVDRERIVYVGSDDLLPEAHRVIDAEEGFVIPGFIDPHVHMGGAPGVPFEEELYRQFKNETEGALRGVTTFGHMIMAPQHESNFRYLDALIKAGTELSYVDFFSHGVVSPNCGAGALRPSSISGTLTKGLTAWEFCLIPMNRLPIVRCCLLQNKATRVLRCFTVKR